MKKRFALLTMLVVTLICLFAISVSAATTETTNIVKHDSDPGLDGAVSSVAGMTIPTYDAETGAYAYDIDARVVLRYTVSAATETEPAVYEYYVFPAYYVISQSSTFSYGFDGLNKALANAGSSLSFSKEGTHKCLSLIRLEIPNGVTSMTQGCKLEGSSNLKELIFPESLTNLGNVQDAFYNLAIESIDLSHVTSVNAALFSSCAQLKTVIWGASTVSARTFSSCSSLTSFTLADGVELTSIGSYAFSKTGFVEFDMPDTVTTLGSHTFQSCTNLKRVNISASSQLTIIPERMFEGCDNIEYIYIPNGVTSIGTCAFEGRTKLTAVENLENSSVTSIGSSAFNNCKSLTSIGLPSTLQTIGSSAFRECTKLTLTNDLSNGVKSIGEYAFKGTAITTITIPGSVESIGSRAFQYCSSLETVYFSASNNGVTLSSVGSNVFGNDNMSGSANTALKKVIFDKNCNITKLGTYMFYNCDGLEFISLPDSVTTIGTTDNGQCFYSCDNLGPVYLSKGLEADKIYWSNLFVGCTNMYFVNEFFTDVAEVTKPTIYYFPNIISSISSEIFKGCLNLNDVLVFGDNLTSVSNGFTFGRRDAKEDMGTKSIVFLGDMTVFSFASENKYTNFYVAGKGTTLTSGTGGTKCNLYVCKEANTNHLFEKQAETDATCLLPAGVHDLCFCGYAISSVVEEGSVPLGHNKPSTGIVVYFPLLNGAPNYFADAHNVYTCTRCSEEQDEEVDNSALFVGDRGYSYEEEGTSVLYRLHVNVDNIKAYSSAFKYGIVVSGAPSTAPISLVDGKITYGAQTLVFEMQSANYEFDYIQAKVTNIGTAELNCQAYAIDNTTVTYIGHNNVNTLAEIVTYDAIVSTYSEKSDEQ